MHKCLIGIWNDYDNTKIVTFRQLKYEVESNAAFAEWKNKNLSGTDMEVKTLNDYLDKRKSTNLQRFDYCPYCGKKIDWKGLRENADSQ